MGFPRGIAVVALGAAFSTTVASQASAQIRAGHLDTFEKGSTQNWAINILGPGSPGGPPPPSALPTTRKVGGVGGANNPYLVLHSVGGTGQGPEPGSRLTVINYGGQWVGDYLAAGISAIRMNAINLGSTDLSLRLLFENPGLPPNPGPPTDEAVSGDPILLAAGSGWQTLTFPLFGTGGLVPLFGSNLNALLSNTTALRILNEPAGGPLIDNGPPIVATLGIDNIRALGGAAAVRATAAPEPSTLALLAGGLALVAGVARKRRRDE